MKIHDDIDANSQLDDYQSGCNWLVDIANRERNCHVGDTRNHEINK